MILRIIPANSPQRARKPCPNDWPCSTTTEVNPPQPSTKQREKSGLAPLCCCLHEIAASAPTFACGGLVSNANRFERKRCGMILATQVLLQVFLGALLEPQLSGNNL